MCLKVAIIPWSKEYYNDQIFNTKALINVDHRLNAYDELRTFFVEKGDEIHTIDMFKNLNEVDWFLCFDYNMDFVLKLSKLGLSNRLIYCNGEPEVVNPRNSKEGYEELKKLFPYILSWNDDAVDDIRIFKRINPYYFEDNDVKKISSQVAFNEKKLLTNISGNKKSGHSKELYSERLKVINYFEEKHIGDFTLYGTGWSADEHPSYEGCPHSKRDVYPKYKFALALENMKEVKGYVTEKMLDCLTLGIVPVYQGAEDIEEYVPKECFIPYDSFDSLDAMYEYLNNMSENRYMEYIEAAARFLSDTSMKNRLSGRQYAKNIYHLIENARYEFEQDKEALKILKIQLIKTKLGSIKRKILR